MNAREFADLLRDYLTMPSWAEVERIGEGNDHIQGLRVKVPEESGDQSFLVVVCSTESGRPKTDG